uniref:(northern house mosquito) hypothetical protein n=1 Tax=Culex pipiens TaxID=7175 RepID=A0A8D8FPU2_CULPI
MASSMGIKCFSVGLSWSAFSLGVVIEVFCFTVFFHFFTRKFIVSLTLTGFHALFFFARDIINQSDKICTAPHHTLRKDAPTRQVREREDDSVEHGQVQREPLHRSRLGLPLQPFPGNVLYSLKKCNVIVQAAVTGTHRGT